MILKEISVEQLTFSCTGCGKVWSDDYDVQHVVDTHGYDRDFYFHNGLSCPDPTAPGEVLCPGCGRGRVVVTLTARRVTPAVTDSPTPTVGSRPAPDKKAARAAAPLLSGVPQDSSS